MHLYKVAVFLLSSCFALSSHAAIIVSVQDAGSNVVVSYSGTLNLSSMMPKEADRNQPLSQLWDIGNGSLQTYNVSGPIDDYNMVSSSIVRPSISDIFVDFLFNGVVAGDSFLVDIDPVNGQIWVRDGYISNEFFSGTNTFSNKTLAGLGAALGTYNWSWSNGANSDSLTLIVGPQASVPEPFTAALLGLGIAGIGLTRKRRK